MTLILIWEMTTRTTARVMASQAGIISLVDAEELVNGLVSGRRRCRVQLGDEVDGDEQADQPA